MDSNTYLKTILLKPTVDSNAFKKVDSEFKKLTDLKIFSKEDAEQFIKERKEFEALKKHAQEIQQAMRSIADIDTELAKNTRKDLEEKLRITQAEIARRSGEFEATGATGTKEKKKLISDETLTDLRKVGAQISETGSIFKNSSSTFANAIGSFNTTVGNFENIGRTILNSFASLITSGLEELDTILDFSKLSNETTRSLAFGYGFSGAESYGYSKAMGALGFSSMEDLWWADTQERDLFVEAMTKYTEKYNELYDSGMFDTLQEYNVEMEEFKEDLKLEVVSFFVENKDTIKSAMTALIDVSKFIISTLGKIAEALHVKEDRTMSERMAAQAAILNNYSNLTTTNISIDNTFNGVDKSDQGWLMNAGQQIFEPVIKAFS